MDIISAIDTAVGCQQCGKPLEGSVSDDFCGEGCQQRWHANRVSNQVDKAPSGPRGFFMRGKQGIPRWPAVGMAVDDRVTLWHFESSGNPTLCVQVTTISDAQLFAQRYATHTLLATGEVQVQHVLELVDDHGNLYAQSVRIEPSSVRLSIHRQSGLFDWVDVSRAIADYIPGLQEGS